MTHTHAFNGPAWIVVPADQPEQFAEAAQAADVVVLDLHNGVLPRDKEFARQCILECPLDPARTVIRVNPVGTDEHAADLQALASTTYRRVAVPKVESAEQLAGLVDYEVVAMIESPHGALALGEIAGASGVVGLMWGSEDLIVNLGGLTSRKCNGALRDISLHVRSQTVLHAAVAGIFAVDGIFLDVENLEGLLGETLDASSSGFAAKGGMHVSQMAVIKEGFRSKPDKLDWARGVVEVAAEQRGSFRHGAQVIDAPVITLAERMVARADASASVTP
ncbi:CoA ester lyase [Kocuria carniphila]|uniref:CoA ester lyase n=1 Tax=Kocuria carniphila TaxID=262208 RepID=UPI0034CE7D2E